MNVIDTIIMIRKTEIMIKWTLSLFHNETSEGYSKHDRQLCRYGGDMMTRQH